MVKQKKTFLTGLLLNSLMDLEKRAYKNFYVLMTSVSRFGGAGLRFPCPECVEKQNQDSVIYKTLTVKCPYH